MTSTNKNLSFGPPPPVTKLTVEQDLKMRLIEDRLNESYDENKKHVINLFLALQRQNFVMGNSLTNLINHWPNEEVVFIHSGEGIPI